MGEMHAGTQLIVQNRDKPSRLSDFFNTPDRVSKPDLQVRFAA